MNYTSFYGHSKNSLNKNRVVIPKDFKNAITVAAKQTFYILPGQDNRCLMVFPADVWVEIISKMAESDEKAVKRRMKAMLMMASKEKLEGNAGRVRLPETLMAMVGITGNKVHFFGEGRYFTIYGEEQGDKKFQEVFNSISEIDFDEF